MSKDSVLPVANNNNIALIISCEHAVNTIPTKYQPLFTPKRELLDTHRAIDFGALAISKYMQEQLQCPMIQATASRLLIDCNRSLHHHHCFSEMTQSLPIEEKNHIIQDYYLSFRQPVINFIDAAIQNHKQVLHLSIHSFTPVLNGMTRQADIGFLYDPKRKCERVFAKNWQHEIRKHTSQYRIRCNYPYRGVSDGFTSYLRNIYTEKHYMGLELETNQLITLNNQSLTTLKKILTLCLQNLIC